MVTTNNIRPVHFFGFSFLTLILFFVFGAPNVQAAYSDLNSRIPDDSYKLLLQNGNDSVSFPNGPDGVFATSDDCYNGVTDASTQRGNCTADNAPYQNGGPGSPSSHQYITLSNGNINDSYNDNSYYGADYSYFDVVTGTKNNKPISLDIVNRRIGSLGCNGYDLRITWHAPDNLSTNIGAVRTINVSGCTSYGGLSFPSSAFRPIIENSKPTGYYKGVMKIEIIGGGARQASFHLNVGNGAKLGYSGNDNWVNTYPTNGGHGHKVSYSFRPPCNVASGTPIQFTWDSLDYGSSFQPSKPDIKVWRHFPNGSGRQLVLDINNPSSGTQVVDSRTVFMNGANFYGPANNLKPYSFTIEFDGIRGGNGISFLYPYSSADAALTCPDKGGCTTPGGCGGGPPPGTGLDCRTYTHNLAPGQISGTGTAIYRITVFPKAQNYRTSTPPVFDPGATPNPGPVSSSRGAWMGFSQAPAYQSGEINTDDPYNDGRASYNPDSNGTGTFSLNLPEPSGPDWFVYIEKWDHSKNWNGSSNNSIDWAYTYGTYSKLNCFSASCDLTVYSNIGGRDGSSPGGIADVAGGSSDVFVYATITNTGLDTLPSTISPNHDLSISSFGDGFAIPFQSNPLGTGIDPGTSASRGFYISVPNDVADRGFYGYPDYYGRGWTNPPINVLGAGCTVRVYTHQPFNITPFANIDSIDEEDPRTIPYTVGGTNSGYPATVNWDRKLYRKTNPADLDGNFNSNNQFSYSESRVYNPGGTPLVPSPLKAGDDVCAWARINTSAGWVGPGNSIIETVGATSNEDCSRIHDRPYLRAYGADVISGSNFTSSGVCNSNPSQIRTYYSNQPDRSGSGIQFAAIAMSSISGFTTASLRSSTPNAPTGLSFANSVIPSGSYTGAPVCATDFYSKKYPDGNPKRINSSAPVFNLTSLNASDNKKQTVITPGGPGRLTLNGTTPGNKIKIKHTVFVDGDVHITGNIVNEAFTDPLTAPALAVVASGNIYIDRSVTRLDGMFVAQKRPDGTRGVIYTCTNNFSQYSASDGAGLVNNCSDQLTINGVFVADDVKFMRTANSLRDSKANVDELAGISKAAEVFNFSPEMLLSPPPFYKDPSAGSKYQFFDTLPPIL